MQPMNDTATPSMSGSEILNSNELNDIFFQSPFEFEAIAEVDSYHVVFWFHVNQYKHFFEHRTYYSRIDANGVSHEDYMIGISVSVISEAKSYCHKIT